MVKSMVMVAVVVALGMPGMAQAETTVSGELIDLNCHLRKTGPAAAGHANEECGAEAAKRGQPLAILGADGTIYIIKGYWTKNKNEKLIEWVAKKVNATGDVSDVNGKKVLKLSALDAAK